MNLKELLTQVQKRSRETIAVTYTSNNDPKIARLPTYADQAVRKIINANEWGFLKKLATITVVDGTTLYDLPSDYFGLVSDTMHRGSTFIPINFVANSQDIVLQKNYNTGQINTGRLYQGKVELINYPAGEATFEYVSNGFVQDAATSNLGLGFNSDNDEFQYPALDELLICATHWMYLRSKGDESAGAAFEDYRDELRRQKINDQGARIIDNTGPRYARIHPPFNPDYEY